VRRAAVLLLACMLVGSLALSATASADVFGSITLLSASPFQQADYAHDPAISGDGRYVVFDGSVGGVTGVWRRENRPGGELQEVAGGDSELPSISADGQYVSFTTNEGAHLTEITNGLPDPLHETHEAPNVYVRNMALPAADGAAFEPVSAASGSLETLHYEYEGGEGLEFEEERYGSVAAGRTALSADGRKAVFVTTARSNLDGMQTPALEVALRNLDTHTTELVSVEYDPATGRPALDESGQTKPVPSQTEGRSTFGAVYSAGGAPPFRPPEAYSLEPAIGASISADGSTAAWPGQDVGEQVRTLPGEPLRASFSEPLWRRVADGELAPTRSVTGGADAESPACVASGEAALPQVHSASDPCQGPFSTERSLGVWTGGEGDFLPRLSSDGYMVAFIANAPLLSLGSDFGVDAENRNSDLYVANMHEGLTRVQALRTLTELASGEEGNIATNAPIVELGIDTAGDQVAFTTRRTVFPLGSPAYVSAPAGVPAMLELFDVDLLNDTLTRVTQGYEGDASEHPHEPVPASDQDQYLQRGDGALSPSFSEDGNTLAFSSTASNLVYGDGNTPPLSDNHLDGADAFAIHRVVFTENPGPQIISEAPPNPAPQPSWSLGVTARSLANGKVQLYVELPGAGYLHASASSTIRSTSAGSAHGAKRTKRRARTGTTVLTRTVAASRQLHEAGAGLSTITLAPGSKYSPLAARAGGLSATTNVTFTAPGRPTLHESVAVTFVRKAKTKARSKTANSKKSKAKRT
jgi:hypothetical protein